MTFTSRHLQKSYTIIILRIHFSSSGQVIPELGQAACLGQDFADDMAVDVGEAALYAVVVEGQPFVIDA